MEAKDSRRFFSCSFSQLLSWDFSSNYLYAINYCSWPVIPLSEITTLRFEVSKKSEIENQQVLLLDRISFDEGKVFAGNRVETKMSQYKAYKGDIIVSKINARKGAIGVVETDIPVGTTIHFRVLTPDNSRIDTKFLQQALRSSFCRNQFEILTGGQGKGEISEKRLTSIEAPFPPLPVQQKIVAYWEAAITKARLLEDQARATIEESSHTFIHELGLSIPKKQESEKVFSAQWKDFDRWSVSYNQAAITMLDLSKGKYPVVELGAILDLVQYGTSEKTNSSGEGVCVIRMNNIVDGDLDLSNLKHLKVSKDIEESLKLLNRDILINRTNSKELVGKCAVFNKNETYIFASYLIRLRVDAEKADPHFVAFTINSPIGRQQINALSRQIIGQANINSQEIRSLKLPLPDLKVQQKLIQNAIQARQKAATLRIEAKEHMEKASTELEQRILGTRSVENI